MELKEITVHSSSEVESMLVTLRGMQLRRELKIINGSFDFHGVLDAEFKVKNSNDRWRVYCVEQGGGYLKKI